MCESRGTCQEHDRPIEAVFLCLACEDERWKKLQGKRDYHREWNHRHVAEIKRLRRNIESLEKQVEISTERRDVLRAASESALEHVTDALLYPDDDELVVELRKVLRQ